MRRLGVGSAVVIGLASMIGAGVFFVWAPATAAAGELLPLALAIAALVACVNALSVSQLAIVHPVSGGAYAFGRATIGPWTGFTAGWLFMWGKTASAAAIALIAGSYLWPGAERIVAVVLIVALATVNMTGIRATAVVSTLIVSVVLAGLAVFVVAALLVPAGTATGPGPESTPLGVLHAAALIFFAFAGYARMATLGEEVREPRKNLPLAIVVALAITLVVYATVAAICFLILGPERLAQSVSPLADVLGGGWGSAIRVVAGLACLGSLAGILAGLSRTGLAMARESDLPGPLRHISARTNAPVVAEATIAVIAAAGAALLEPATLVGLSSCAVLGYYAIANLAAFRQPRAERWLPRALPTVGVIACATLAVSLPPLAVVTTAGILALGLAVRALRLKLRR